MRTRHAIAVLALSVGTAQLAAADPPSRTAERGRALFTQYCAACHGGSARGDGTLSGALRTPPADLTRIAERRAGKFPDLEIIAFIDGRRNVMAHGDREMPVWGERFSDMAEGSLPSDKAASVQSKMRSLVDFLKSIQAPAAAEPDTKR